MKRNSLVSTFLVNFTASYCRNRLYCRTYLEKRISPIFLRVKLGHFRKMVYWSVVRICLYLACIRIQRRDTYRWGLFSFFHKPTESKPSHLGVRKNKASLFFLCPLKLVNTNSTVWAEGAQMKQNEKAFQVFNVGIARFDAICTNQLRK